MEKYKLVKISILLIDAAFVLLAALIVGLPFLITWYVEIMNRSASLATVVMLTSYPCAPFVGYGLFLLRRFLKEVIKGELFGSDSLKYLIRLAICCAVITVITLIAGFFYMPFFFVAMSFGFMALLVFSLFSVGKVY